MSAVLWIWLAAALIFLIIEIFSPGFVFACFVVGSVAAGLTSMGTDSLLIQGTVFAVVSLVLIPLTRPLAQKITKPSPVQSNVDALIGKTGIVLKEVDETAGQIKVNEDVWQARSDEVIAVGLKVTVLAVEGARLKVKKSDS